MNLEEIKNRCDNRYDKLRDAELDVEWLIDEVERLENLKYMGINAEYVETIKRLRAEVKSLTKRLEMVTYGDMITHKQGCPCVQCTQTKYG